MISIFIDMDSVNVIGIKLIEDIGFKLEIGSAMIKSFGLVEKHWCMEQFTRSLTLTLSENCYCD